MGCTALFLLVFACVAFVLDVYKFLKDLRPLNPTEPFMQPRWIAGGFEAAISESQFQAEEVLVAIPTLRLVFTLVSTSRAEAAL
ncbi:hypothetical protein C8T65DRAFT_736416 [Cerioporus squamosus]|nr:hypothetical protein C8T65DRAFT_736416 [Cerioporus squamosus]